MFFHNTWFARASSWVFGNVWRRFCNEGSRRVGYAKPIQNRAECVKQCCWYMEFTAALQRKSHLCVPRKGIARPQSQFSHLCVYDRFIYDQNRSTYFPTAAFADRSWQYMNRSQTHECGNSYWGRVIPFLGIFVSNFWYCVHRGKLAPLFHMHSNTPNHHSSPLPPASISKE
jgi:hypothetical protein